MSDRYETEADAFFREDARVQGYLATDNHEPGNGRGLWAYYRDNGMVPPEVLDRVIPKRELGYWDGFEDRGEVSSKGGAADLTGKPMRVPNSKLGQDWGNISDEALEDALSRR